MSFYNTDWTRKSNIELYREGLLPPPSGYILNETNNTLIEMSQIEKITAGLEKRPADMKIENENMISMSDAELLDAKQITSEEYRKRTELRIQSDIEQLERKSLRSVIAILSGEGTSEDAVFFNTYKTEIAQKRNELHLMHTIP